MCSSCLKDDVKPGMAVALPVGDTLQGVDVPLHSVCCRSGDSEYQIMSTMGCGNHSAINVICNNPAACSSLQDEVVINYDFRGSLAGFDLVCSGG